MKQLTVFKIQRQNILHIVHCALCAVLVYNICSAQQYKYITGLHDKKQKQDSYKKIQGS